MLKQILYTSLTAIVMNAVGQTSVNSPLTILEGHTNDVLTLSSYPNAEIIASGGWDKMINIYKGDSMLKLVKSFQAHEAAVTALAHSKDGKLLASGSLDNTIRIWDSIYNPIRKLEGHSAKINALLFDPTKRYVISGGDDRQIIFWDLKLNTQLKKIENNFAVNSFVLGPDNRSLYVAGNEPTIKIYTIGSWQVGKTLIGHSDAVNDIAISPNGKLLLSGSNDKTARIWDLTTGKEVRKLAVDCWKVQAVAFTNNGKYAATGCNDGKVKIWDVETGKLVATITAENENVKSLVFTKNNHTITLANTLRGKTDYGVRVWPTFIANLTNQSSTAKLDSVKTKPATIPNNSQIPVKPKPSGR